VIYLNFIISERRVADVFLRILSRRVRKPPFYRDNACCTSKFRPYTLRELNSAVFGQISSREKSKSPSSIHEIIFLQIFEELQSAKLRWWYFWYLLNRMDQCQKNSKRFVLVNKVSKKPPKMLNFWFKT